jgi:hypothetical protein
MEAFSTIMIDHNLVIGKSDLSHYNYCEQKLHYRQCQLSYFCLGFNSTVNINAVHQTVL